MCTTARRRSPTSWRAATSWPISPSTQGCCTQRCELRSSWHSRRRDSSTRLISAADRLLLESLVLATRLERREAAAALTTLTENLRVVGKVAPGSAYESALAALLRDLGLSS